MGTVNKSVLRSRATAGSAASEISVKESVAAIFKRREVDVVFGNPGSTELTFLAGLPEEVQYVMGLQETSVTAMAAGYALRTGRTPVISLHTAPGLGNAIGVIHNLLESRLAAVVIVGQQDSRHLGTDPALSFDLVAMATPVTKWAHQPIAAEDVPGAIEKAFRIAEAGSPGPVLLSIPMDFFEGRARPVPIVDVILGGGVDEMTAAAVAEELLACEMPAIVTGADVELTEAWDETIALAEALGASVYTAPFQPATGFPTAHPCYAHSLPFTSAGIMGVLERHSHVLVLGSPVFRIYPYTDVDVTDLAARMTVISNDPIEIGRVDAGRATVIESRLEPALQAILKQLPARDGPAWTSVNADTAPRPPRDDGAGDAITVHDACEAVAAGRPRDAVLVDESISSGVVLAKYWKTEEPRTNLRAANGGLGFAMPAAVGAAVADPQTTVVCVVGDGSFSYSPQALWTAAELALPVKTVVLRNGGYKVLADYHDSVSAHLGELPSMEIDHIDTASIALGWGVPARRISAHVDLADSIDWLYQSEGPALLEIEVEWSAKSMFE
jgi:benzoylformate decarboxylase